MSPVAINRETAAHSTSVTASQSVGGSGRRVAVSNAAPSHAHAIRQGSRAAASPPGCRTGNKQTRAFEFAEVAGEDLASPDGAVGPVARAVEDRPHRLLGDAVLRQARRQMRVVVLDRDGFDALARERVTGRQVVGMEVVGDDLGLDREQSPEMVDPAAIGLERLEVLQVSHVGTDPRAGALGDAEGVLELGPAAEDRTRGCERQRDRRGCVAARAPDQHWRLTNGPVQRSHHGVVGARLDRPVVDQQRIRDLRQPCAGIRVDVGDRLVGEVARRHHQRLVRVRGE